MASPSDEERPLVHLRERGRLTIPKELRADLTTEHFYISVDDDGVITLDPAAVVSQSESEP